MNKNNSGSNLRNYILWKTLNRLWVEIAKTMKKLMRWKIGKTAECECGVVQNDQHKMGEG